METKEALRDRSIEIKLLEESDIEQLVPILHQHVRNRDTGELETDEITNIQKYMRGEPDEDKRVRKYLVAKDETGKIWGCMAYSVPDNDMRTHFDLQGDEAAELLNAFVSKDVFRGGGVGKKLFDAVCSQAKSEGKTQIVINSGPRYKASWGFYDKMCGSNSGLIIEKYGKDGDAMTWRKWL